MLDRLEELSIQRLATPMKRDTYEARQDHGFVSDDQSSIRKTHVIGAHDTISPLKIPTDEKHQHKYWEKVDKQLQTKGLDLHLDEEPVKLTREVIEEYNIGPAALKLAILFGAEDAYDKSIGQLVAA